MQPENTDVRVPVPDRYTAYCELKRRLGGEPAGKIFSVGEGGGDNTDGPVIGGTVTSRYPASQREGAYIEETRHSEGAGGKILQLNDPVHSNDRIYSDQGISPALNTMQGGHRQPEVIRQPLRFLTRNQKNVEGDYASTVDASQTSGLNVEGRIRKLMPIECERLMGWPDSWTAKGVKADGTAYGMSDSARYKMCGNGVVSPVVCEIIKGMYGLGETTPSVPDPEGPRVEGQFGVAQP